MRSIEKYLRENIEQSSIIEGELTAESLINAQSKLDYSTALLLKSSDFNSFGLNPTIIDWVDWEHNKILTDNGKVGMLLGMDIYTDKPFYDKDKFLLNSMVVKLKDNAGKFHTLKEVPRMDYSVEALNEAATKGKIVTNVNRISLEKAYNYYRDNGKLVPNETKLMLVIKAVDYPDFINDADLKGWFERNTHNKSYRLGLVGHLSGIEVFSDIFLDFENRVLDKNILFIMPKAA